MPALLLRRRLLLQSLVRGLLSCPRLLLVLPARVDPWWLLRPQLPCLLLLLLAPWQLPEQLGSAWPHRKAAASSWLAVMAKEPRLQERCLNLLLLLLLMLVGLHWCCQPQRCRQLLLLCHHRPPLPPVQLLLLPPQQAGSSAVPMRWGLAGGRLARLPCHLPAVDPWAAYH